MSILDTHIGTGASLDRLKSHNDFTIKMTTGALPCLDPGPSSDLVHV